MTSKIGRQFATERPAALHPFDDMIEGFDVGPTEGVDRLFWIADNEEFPWLEFGVAPRGRLRPRLLGEIEHDFVLHRIGILEFIDEQRSVVSLQLSADGRIIAKQRASLADQTVKGQPTCVYERLPHRLHER